MDCVCCVGVVELVGCVVFYVECCDCDDFCDCVWFFV